MHDYDDEFDIDEGKWDAFQFAQEFLRGSFVWADSDEGHEFYDGLFDILSIASLRAEESDWDSEEGFYQPPIGRDPYAHAADHLDYAFDWSETFEGYDFWDAVSEILDDLSEGNLPTGPVKVVPYHDQFDDVQEPYSEGDQPDLPRAVEDYFAALDKVTSDGETMEILDDRITVEGALLQAQETFDAYIEETGHKPDVMHMEFQTPDGVLVVQATRIA